MVVIPEVTVVIAWVARHFRPKFVCKAHRKFGLYKVPQVPRIDRIIFNLQYKSLDCSADNHNRLGLAVQGEGLLSPLGEAIPGCLSRPEQRCLQFELSLNSI
jgi:hypothetical protein